MISGYIEEMGKKAKEASKKLLTLDTRIKNKALIMIAEELINKKEEIKEANRIDLENGKKEGLSFALLDRLELTDKRIEAMSQGLMEIAAFTDPIGEILSGWRHKNGMTIEKKRVPSSTCAGVLGIILTTFLSLPAIFSTLSILIPAAITIIILFSSILAFIFSRTEL